MNRGRARRRREEELLHALERVVTPRRRALLPALIWAWRKELALALGIAVLFVAVVHTSSLIWAIAGLSAAAGVLSPPWSGQLKAFGWQLITPRRVRIGLYQARIQNRSGRRPVIIRVTSEPFGERVRLWCPAGISAEDIFAATDVLRAACWAADIWVARDEQRSHLVTVDVIRRPDDIERPGGMPGRSPGPSPGIAGRRPPPANDESAKHQLYTKAALVAEARRDA